MSALGSWVRWPREHPHLPDSLAARRGHVTDCGQWAVSGSGQGPQRASDTLRSPPSSAVATGAQSCGWSGRRAAWKPRPSGNTCGALTARGWFEAQPGLSGLREDEEGSQPCPWKSSRGVLPPLRGQCSAGLAPKLCPLHSKQVQNLTDRVGVLEECI